jgi:hypothetical protein
MRSPILTLDLSGRSTGLAYWSPGRMPFVETVSFYGKGRSFLAVASAHWDWFMGVCMQWEPATVVFEQPILPSSTTPSTVRMLNGIAWNTELICDRAGVPTCMEVRASRWRKHFTGSGSWKGQGRCPVTGRKLAMNKVASIQAALDRGFSPKNADEADALGMLDYAASLAGLPTDWRSKGVLVDDEAIS